MNAGHKKSGDPIPFGQLNLDDLQANILKSHGRNFSLNLFLQFTGSAKSVREWISSLRITSAGNQKQHSLLRKNQPDFDGGIVTCFFLSANGFQKLSIDPEELPEDLAFRRSMKDWITCRELNDPPVYNWEDNYKKSIDAMMLLADNSLDNLIRKAKEIAAQIEGSQAGKVLFIENGKTLKIGDTQFEHFGYADGISQPEFWDSNGNLILSNLDIVLVKEKEGVNRYGSYLVFRKLEQDVAGFYAKIEELRKLLGVSHELAGAQVIGRFKDGTPLNLYPSASNAPVNDFNYEDDKFGSKCPFHAHVRKMRSTEDEKRRIVRRGIPYDESGKSVGLLFMSYQRSIGHQFEFIQKNWANNPEFPQGFTGPDPISGQSLPSDYQAQHWNQGWNQPSSPRSVFEFGSVVKLKGGEYFYAPSLSFLKNLKKRSDKGVSKNVMPSPGNTGKKRGYKILSPLNPKIYG